MIDKEDAKCFLEDYFQTEGENPKNIDMDKLAEVFLTACEDDTYDWFRDNARAFFESSGDTIDWGEISDKIEKHFAKKENGD